MSSGNYAFQYADGGLGVTPATLTVAANNASRLYGDANPTFTGSITGFKNGETLATCGVTGSPLYSSAALPTSPVGGGPYTITTGQNTLSATNYVFATANGQLNVTPALLTVTADHQSRAYGNANPALTASFSGFKNGETLATSGVSGSPSLSTVATPSSPVGLGPYAILAGQGTLTSGNYSFSFADGTLAVTQAGLTVTADDQTREYGDANPLLTDTITGFVNGETLATSDVKGAAVMTTSAVATSPVAGCPTSSSRPPGRSPRAITASRSSTVR